MRPHKGKPDTRPMVHPHPTGVQAGPGRAKGSRNGSTGLAHLQRDPARPGRWWHSVRNRQAEPAQVLFSVQSGSRRLRGSSAGRAARRPCPLWACRKLCLLIRCFPRKELSREKASGVREASSSREDEGAPRLGTSGAGGSSSGCGASGRGGARGGGEEGGWVASGRLGGRAAGSAGPGRLAAGDSSPPGGRMLSLAIVA